MNDESIGTDEYAQRKPLIAQVSKNINKRGVVLLGTIHILRHHIFGIFGPPSPLRQHVFSTKNKQKLAFSDPPPPLQVLT